MVLSQSHTTQSLTPTGLLRLPKEPSKKIYTMGPADFSEGYKLSRVRWQRVGRVGLVPNQEKWHRWTVWERDPALAPWQLSF